MEEAVEEAREILARRDNRDHRILTVPRAAIVKKFADEMGRELGNAGSSWFRGAKLAKSRLR